MAVEPNDPCCSTDRLQIIVVWEAKLQQDTDKISVSQHSKLLLLIDTMWVLERSTPPCDSEAQAVEALVAYHTKT